MQEKVITLATPAFFLLIFVELVVGLLRRRHNYRVNDAINSLSLGVLSQVSGVFMHVLRIGIYAWLVRIGYASGAGSSRHRHCGSRFPAGPLDHVQTAVICTWISFTSITTRLPNSIRPIAARPNRASCGWT
jgi:hypothetical protein